jgi:hypothetical protein
MSSQSCHPLAESPTHLTTTSPIVTMRSYLWTLAIVAGLATASPLGSLQKRWCSFSGYSNSQLTAYEDPIYIFATSGPPSACIQCVDDYGFVAYGAGPVLPGFPDFYITECYCLTASIDDIHSAVGDGDGGDITIYNPAC